MDELTKKRITLESCICGEHTYCPDGYHGDEQNCICTAPCAENDPELHQYDGFDGPCTLCEQPEAAHA